MGDWSEAMEDGVLCRGCACPLGSFRNGGYCDSCASRRAIQNTSAESPLDRARAHKESTSD